MQRASPLLFLLLVSPTAGGLNGIVGLMLGKQYVDGTLDAYKAGKLIAVDAAGKLVLIMLQYGHLFHCGATTTKCFIWEVGIAAASMQARVMRMLASKAFESPAGTILFGISATSGSFGSGTAQET